MTRYAFADLFQDIGDGRLRPRFKIRIGGVILSPGITFDNTVTFSGLYLFDYIDSDIEVENVNGVLVIKGFYHD